jgi:Uncharacterized alpha/beta hydrolase domain (DUF2235)
MPLIGLAIAIANELAKPKKEVKKEKLKIRFSLFYDGTNNNRNNILAREKAEINMKPAASDEQSKKELAAYKEHGGGDSSYDNGRTNIANMEPLVMPTQDGYDHYFKIYIEGQGTENLVGDSSIKGKGLGSFGTGIASKAENGVREAVLQLQEFLKTKPPEEFEIEKIDVDVFGFSRGAAAARHSISLMLEWLEPDTILPNRPLYKRIRVHGYDMSKKMVEIKFAGLYDTVVSVNGSQLNYWADNKLNQRAVALATKSVHLCAAEEHRLDFPLHTIKSAINKGKGKEYYLPGVHSDVGGSYNLGNDLNKEPMRTSSEVNRIINSGAGFILDIDRDRLIEAGWYKPNEIKKHSFAVGYLEVNRKNIKSAYCNIPLKLMAKLATENGIKFRPNLNQRANQILSKEPDLKSLEASINSYVAKMGASGSKPEDWIEDARIHHNSLKFPMTSIRHDHFHMSSKTTALTVFNPGFTPRFTAILGKRRRYYYDG